MNQIPHINVINIDEILKVSKLNIKSESKYSFSGTECFFLFFVKDGALVINTESDSYQLESGQMIILNIKSSIKFFSPVHSGEIIISMFTLSNDDLNQLLNRPIMIKDYQKSFFDSLAQISEEINLLKFRKPSITYDKEIAIVYNISCSLLYATLSQILLVLLSDNAIKKVPLDLEKSIQAARNNKSLNIPEKSTNAESNNNSMYENQLVNQIIAFMKINLDKSFSINEIAQEFFVGSANLKKIFKKETGYSIMTYFKILKMNTAKEWIRENELSYTEIAKRLNFSSIHHFSTAFKKYTGYSPSKYYNMLKSGSIDEIDAVNVLINQRPWST